MAVPIFQICSVADTQVATPIPCRTPPELFRYSPALHYSHDCMHCNAISMMGMQDMARKLEEETRAKNKLLKRQGKHEDCAAAEAEHLHAQLAHAHSELHAAESRAREAAQAMDSQQAAAAVQEKSLQSHIQVLEADVRRLTEQAQARERELTATYDDRLHLELKQQQLRYERRLQVCTPRLWKC